jgi:hypothetical protein
LGGEPGAVAGGAPGSTPWPGTTGRQGKRLSLPHRRQAERSGWGGRQGQPHGRVRQAARARGCPCPTGGKPGALAGGGARVNPTAGYDRLPGPCGYLSTCEYSSEYPRLPRVPKVAQSTQGCPEYSRLPRDLRLPRDSRLVLSFEAFFQDWRPGLEDFKSDTQGLLPSFRLQLDGAQGHIFRPFWYK